MLINKYLAGQTSIISHYQVINVYFLKKGCKIVLLNISNTKLSCNSSFIDLSTNTITNQSKLGSIHRYKVNFKTIS